MTDPASAKAFASSTKSYSWRELVPLLVALALLSALHLPGTWRGGRFFDEEANVFFAYAWHFPAADALLRPFAGYLNLAANALTLALAHLVKSGAIALEHAPYFTMLLGLMFQMVPVLLVLTGEAAWLSSRRMRLAAALFIAIAPGTEEVFANVIHIQFHLALSVALILTFDFPRSRARQWLYAMALVLAPLCGPAAILLLPLYALRAFLDRDRGRWWQCLWLAAGSLAQLAIFYGDSPIRGLRPDLLTAGAGTFLRLVVLPLLGTGMADKVAMKIALSQQQDGTGLTFVFAALCLLVFGALLASSVRQRSSDLWLVAACLAIAVPSFTLGLASAYRTFVLFPSAGSRYNYIPVVLLGLAVMARLAAAKGGRRTLLLGASLMGLTTTAVAYIRPNQAYNGGPSWQGEVAKWRADPAYGLRVWSSDRLVDLSGDPRPCRPPRRPKGDFDAPQYCEAGWMTDFWPDQTRAPHEKAPAR